MLLDEDEDVEDEDDELSRTGADSRVLLLSRELLVVDEDVDASREAGAGLGLPS